MHFWTFAVRIWKFQEVLQSCNMLQPGVGGTIASTVGPVCRHVLTIISVKILHKCDETSMTAISLALNPILNGVRVASILDRGESPPA